MVNLTLLNHRKPNQPFKHSMLLAIFWESHFRQRPTDRGAAGWFRASQHRIFSIKPQPRQQLWCSAVDTNTTALDDNCLYSLLHLLPCPKTSPH